VSPAASWAVATWYRSRGHTRWYGAERKSFVSIVSRPQPHGIVGDAMPAPE